MSANVSDGGGQYIRDYYGIAATVGDRLSMDGRVGELVGFAGHYLLVRFDDEPNCSFTVHPTWTIGWLEQQVPS